MESKRGVWRDVVGDVRTHPVFIEKEGLRILDARMTTAVLLTRPVTRQSIWLTGLILVRHGVSFHGSAYDGSQFGFVPDKEKCGSQSRNYLSLRYSDLRLLIYIFLSSGTAPCRSNLIRQQAPRVPISLYEHTSITRRTSGNPCSGATIGCEHH
jgi:hypothetical protein